MNLSLTSMGSRELKSSVKAFLDWWIKELKDLASGFLLGSDKNGDNMILVMPGDKEAIFLHRKGQHWQELGRCHPESTAEEVADIISGAGGGKRYITVRLSSTSGLRRELNLPLATEEDLKQVLTYQLDTLSPYPPDEIYFDYRVTGKDAEKNSLQVDLIIAPRSIVDDAVKQMNKWGLTPECMDIENRGQLTQPQCNLLPSSLIPEKPPTSLSTFNKLLLAVNLALLVALAATHLMGLATTREELQTRMETAKLKAEATLKIREKVDKLKEEAVFFQNLKTDTVPKIAILEELTHILPDETWLDRAFLEENRIKLFGLSSEASNLLSEIEKSPMFENVAFQAPVVQEKRFGKERFQISADLTVVSSDGN